MNSFGGFDDDDEDYTNVASNRLASIFKTETPKAAAAAPQPAAKQQPQQKPKKEADANSGAQPVAGVAFFANIQLFKYVNNAYESQGRAGLAVLSNTVNNALAGYRVLIYVTKTQPIASIKLTPNFKLIVQANNYASFYDEANQPWSVMFENEAQTTQFATQVTLAKFNLTYLTGTYDANKVIVQDLRASSESTVVEANDSVEIATLVTHWKDMKLDEVIENTQSKPFKVKLGKAKLPVALEESLLNLKQGTRRLIIAQNSKLQPLFSNVPLNATLFYDVTVQRVKKHVNKEAADEQLNSSMLSDDSSRQRSDSVKEKAKALEHIDEASGIKSEKSKLISRMAKMGKPMLPLSGAVIANIESDDDADHQSKYQFPSQQQQQYQPQQHNFVAPQQPQLVPNMMNAQYQQAMPTTTIITNPADMAATALYQQQVQFQQQLQQQQLQQQQQQQQMLSANQLALYKPMTQQIMQLQPPVQQQQLATPQTPAEDIGQHRQQTILVKLDTINEKLEQLKAFQQQSNNSIQSVPNMETTTLLSNLQRIIKENEQYKKELYEKSGKIEELNAKITDYLARNQSFIEKSHLLLEQKNSSYSDASEKNVMRILELEQDKMKLTQELTQLTGKMSEINLQVNRQNMAEFELKQRLNEISKSYDLEKNEIERLKLDNLELKSKFDAAVDEFKKERQHKKQIELDFNKLNEEKNEFRDQVSNYEKLLSEKRAKYEADKKQHERDMDETKQQYTSEISDLKERLNKYRTNTNEMNKESAKQLEADLTNEWKMKLEKALKAQEQKYERTMEEMNVEKENLVKQLESVNEQFKAQRERLNQAEISNEELNERIDALNLVEEKFKRLQSQAIVMKERYEARIKELLDAEPDSDVLNEYVKKCMNNIFQKIKLQINVRHNYSGEGVLAAILKTIKFVTIQLMREKDADNEYEEEDIDYFSEFVVDFDGKLDEQKDEYERKIQNMKEEFNSREQLMTLQHEVRLKAVEMSAESSKRQEVRVLTQEPAVVSSPNVAEPVALENEEGESNFDEIDEKEIAESKVEAVEVVQSEAANEDVKADAEAEQTPTIEQPVGVEEVIEKAVEELKQVEEDLELIETAETHQVEEVAQMQVEEKVELETETSTTTQPEEEKPKIDIDEVPSPEPLEEKAEEEEEEEEDNSKSIYDLPDDNIKQEAPKPEIKTLLPESDSDDDFFKPKPPSTDATKEEPKQPKKKSLFSDNEDEDDMFLFSNTKTTTSKPNSRSSSTLKADDNKPAFTTSSNSFEPPPLLDNDENKDDDIDWFK